MSAIVFDKVWKEYGDHVVLEQIDLQIEPRAFLALVGPSGCGKTTFLRMLLGEERPTRGRHPAGQRAAHARAGFRPRRGVPALLGVSTFDGARQRRHRA